MRNSEPVAVLNGFSGVEKIGQFVRFSLLIRELVRASPVKSSQGNSSQFMIIGDVQQSILRGSYKTYEKPAENGREQGFVGGRMES